MGYLSTKFKNEGIPFMDGKEKGELKNYLDRELHISDYGFIYGEDGKYAVLQFRGLEQYFFFGNSIITDNLLEMEKDLGSKDEVLKMFDSGSVTFEQKTNKRGNRQYIAPIYKD